MDKILRFFRALFGKVLQYGEGYFKGVKSIELPMWRYWLWTVLWFLFGLFFKSLWRLVF